MKNNYFLFKADKNAQGNYNFKFTKGTESAEKAKEYLETNSGVENGNYVVFEKKHFYRRGPKIEVSEITELN